MIGDAATTRRSTVVRQRRDVRSPDVPALTTILTAASVFVMYVPAAALRAFTGRQRQLGCLPRQESPSSVFVRGPATGWPCLDTHRVEWIRNPMHLHGAPRVLHLRLDSPTVPPGSEVEFHGSPLSMFGARILLPDSSARVAEDQIKLRAPSSVGWCCTRDLTHHLQTRVQSLEMRTIVSEGPRPHGWHRLVGARQFPQEPAIPCSFHALC